MAGVKVTISGFIAPLGKSAEDQPYPAVITGTASYTGLGVGGGQDKWLVQTYWTPETGWGVAIIPGPGHPGVPTPSKK